MAPSRVVAGTVLVLLRLLQQCPFSAAIRVSDQELELTAQEEGAAKENFEQRIEATAHGAVAKEAAGEEGIDLVLPNCGRIVAHVATAPKELASWCKVDLVPEASRVPAKLRGLYWFQGADMSDVAVCFSTGRWEASSRTLTLNSWADFVFKDSYGSLALVASQYQAGMKYRFKFTSSSLTAANIDTQGNWLGAVPLFLFDAFTSFTLEEVASSTAGEKWAKMSVTGVWPFTKKVQQYQFVRVVDGIGKVEANAKGMVAALAQESGVFRIPETCSAETLGQSVVAPGSATCGAGVYLALAKQASLGLRYLDVPQAGAASVHFGQFSSSAGCVVNYHLRCSSTGHATVDRTKSCPTGAALLREPGGSAPGAWSKKWEACADTGGELKVMMPLVEATYGTATPAGAPVQGCLQLLAASEWPELAIVRGSMTEMQAAVRERMRDIGGCPLFRNKGDRVDRGNDFPAFSMWLPMLQRKSAARASAWAEVGKVRDWFETWANDLGDKVRETASSVFELAFFAAGTGLNRTTAFNLMGEVNCGEPAPFMGGPMVFRHEQVAGMAGSPDQIRQFTTATVEASTMCFDPTMLIFLSTGSPEHTETRKLLDEAGFDALDKEELAAIPAGKIPNPANDDAAPTEMEVGRFTLPWLMQGIWGKKPTDADVETVLPYLELAKICIFGKTAEKLGIIKGDKIKAIRQYAANFGRDSPRATKVGALLPGYPAIQKQAAAKGKVAQDMVVENVADISLFAGLLGTTDMTTKCVQNQWKDNEHVRLYRKDKRAYLHELMRHDGAVTSYTTATKEEKFWDLEGLDVQLSAKTPVQMVFASANRDASVFPSPAKFDPTRPELGEQLAWNGRLKYVKERNYQGAPRFCPGYHLSVKIAELVCDHLTQNLQPWGKASNDTGKWGKVEVLTGMWKGRQGMVRLFDFAKKQYCVVDVAEEPPFELGCYPDHELKVTDGRASFSEDLATETQKCPPGTAATVRSIIDFGLDHQDGFTGSLIPSLLGKSKDVQTLRPEFADDFATALYASILHTSLRWYKAKHADNVPLPTRTGMAPEFRIKRVRCPSVDIDNLELKEGNFMTNFFANIAKKHIPSFDCIMNWLREMEFDDRLDTPGENTWKVALNGTNFKRKSAWLTHFWTAYKDALGDPIWPAPEVDFSQLFLKGDIWDDGLEKVMAFENIGVHRVRRADKVVGGETLAFAVELNSYSGIATREHMSKMGANMYFTAEGLPALIVTPDGREILRGDKDWQYWKFVWRSSLVTIITLVDHLHITHLKVANLLAKVTRRALSPDHPMRRLLSIFTFNTININLAAMHTLVGPNHAMHRASPFKDFEALSDAVPTSLPDTIDVHAHFLKDEVFEKLPTILQKSPYFADGRLLFKAIHKMVKNYIAIYEQEFCQKGVMAEKDLNLFATEIMQTMKNHSGMVMDHDIEWSCSRMVDRFAATFWTVTGWHRHVGTIADFYKDPELAAWSWKEGEASPRPQQAFISSVIVAVTGTQQPKLIEDFTPIFANMRDSEKAQAVWREFQKDLLAVQKAVKANNEGRAIKNFHADPAVVECSVAV